MLKRFLTVVFLLLAIPVFAHDDGETDGNQSFPFIENKGQWHENVKFKSNFGETVVFFEKDAFHYQIYSRNFNHAGIVHEVEKEGIQVLKAKFINSNPNVKIQSNNESGYYFNYFLGNDPAKWKSKVRSYQEIRYQNLYKGIDLKVYKKNGYFKYDYLLETGADTSQIQIRYEGVEKPEIIEGNLIISHEFGEIIEEKPYAYQKIDGKLIEVPCDYVLSADNTLSFSFPKGYNNKFELVIDPRVIFSTYSGASDNNLGMTAERT